jgi:hypothetical protein
MASPILLGRRIQNLIFPSEDITAAAFSKYQCTATGDNLIAPDGTMTGDTLTDTASNDFHTLDYSTTPLALRLQCRYVFSAFLQAGTMNTAVLSPTAGNSSRFDLAGGTVISQGAGTLARIEQAPNGWWRCSIAFNNTTATGNATVVLNLDASYSGSGSNIGVWGVQLNAGNAPDAYIKTLAGSATKYL